jgi:DNA sulfur modification protein DndC
MREQKGQLRLFGESFRLQMTDSIRMTQESLAAYGELHDHWTIAWSGGKDSTALLTIVVWMILAGRVKAPRKLSVLYADTRLELLPLWLSAASIREELEDKREALAALGCDLDVRVVLAPLDKRFMVYVLGRGVPPPNNTTLRWCTRQTKVDPMREELERLFAEGDVLTLTGVRVGESAARDARIALSCSRGSARVVP